MRNEQSIICGSLISILVIFACNLPANISNVSQPTAGLPQTSSSLPEIPVTLTESVPVTSTASGSVLHTKTPSLSGSPGKPTYDVDSSGTASEKRAPYGDSYDINRLERPFLQDMTYVPDLDIETFSLSSDIDFYYVSIDLVGGNPNNPLGIQYGVELDTNADGFGDFIILARQPFSTEWATSGVQVFSDSNHDTAGLSGDKSDAPISTNGYDKLIFDGSTQSNSDPDLAWVRINYSDAANVQFAFKKSWAGSSFMYGVLADAGLKDVGKLDYVDRFQESEAGSPVKDKKYYPLGALFAVDNTCREVFGFKPNGYEPMICPKDQPNPTKKPTLIPGTPFIPPILICLSKGTLIETPNGEIPVEELKAGDFVWTVDRNGTRVIAPIVRVSHTNVIANHMMAHIKLEDGRELLVSPGHPTTDGRFLGDLKPGDMLDGAPITQTELVPYNGSATYDLLPSAGTGFYWANGILIGSTLAK
jgi:hypothetical protein